LQSFGILKLVIHVVTNHWALKDQYHTVNVTIIDGPVKIVTFIFTFNFQVGNKNIIFCVVNLKRKCISLLVMIICTALPLQVFDNTPAARDGTLQSGDELVGVNGASVKGKTKVEVAKMIQASKVRNAVHVGISGGGQFKTLLLLLLP
jgi:predicted metalloprotease with PDZ domain